MMEYVPGPDFPTGAIDPRPQRHPRGLSSSAAARWSCAPRPRSRRCRGGREAIIVTEVPYQVNKARLLERIAEVVRDKKVEGISELRDESDRDGVRVVIELKRDAMADVVLNQLYRFTPLQTSFGVNTLALDGGRPRLMSLRELLEAFIRFRAEVITRRTKFELGQARERAHILVGLAIAVANIDEVIALIRRCARSGRGARALDGQGLAGLRRGAADRADRRARPRGRRPRAPTSSPRCRRAPSSSCACSA